MTAHDQTIYHTDSQLLFSVLPITYKCYSINSNSSNIIVKFTLSLKILSENKKKLLKRILGVIELFNSFIIINTLY